MMRNRKLKRRIKAVFYNDIIDMLFLCAGSIVAILALVLKNFCLMAVMLIVILLYLVFYIRYNCKFNNSVGKLSCLKLSKSLIIKNSVWINQRNIIVRGNDNKCPQKEFVRELSIVLNSIPKGTVCYCCTHEKIKKQIVKKFPNAKCTVVYKKDLLKLKRRIKSKKCKLCTNQNCTLKKNDMTFFYAIKYCSVLCNSTIGYMKKKL